MSSGDDWDVEPLGFLARIVRGPAEGLSEYLVQKTQAGMSFPFGPFTIPGGQSASLTNAGEVGFSSAVDGLFTSDLGVTGEGVLRGNSFCSVGDGKESRADDEALDD